MARCTQIHPQESVTSYLYSVCVSVCMCVCTQVCIYVSEHVCVCVCLCLCIYGPGVNTVSNRNEYQEHFLGVKATGA